MDLSMLELVARLLLACLCGIVIGIERNSRAKEAGIRTHCIVACASALMMIVSKYGFFDLIESTSSLASDVRLDPSRMAQGIVTGVGFLGAGMIYVRRGLVKGLTTAAGVWAISGIGMAIGAGMYVIGITATAIVLILQIVLHTKSMFASKYKTKVMKISGVREDNFQATATAVLEELGIAIIDVSLAKNEDDSLDYSFFVEIPTDLYEENLVKLFDYKCSVKVSQ